MTVGRKARVNAMRTTRVRTTPCRAVVLTAAALLPLLAILPVAAQQAGEAKVWTSQSQYPAGEKIVVLFSGLPGNDSDWIAVVPENASDDTWGNWSYTRGKTEGELEFPGLPEGRYQVRLYFNWAATASYEVKYRHGFVVGAAGPVPREGGGLVWTSQDVYPPEAPITVHFARLPGNASDWICVVSADEPETAWGTWRYTEGKTEGQMEFPGLPRGRYQVRVYFDWAGTGSYQVRDRHSFWVGDPPPHFEGLAITEHARYAPGQSITVFFARLPGNASDWIAVVPAGSPDSTSGEWKYTHGKTSGMMEFPPLPPGHCEVRVFFDWDGTRTYEVRYRHQFTVGEGGEG